jgi:hypothetical protein
MRQWWHDDDDNNNLLLLLLLLLRSRDRAVGIATGYGLDDRGVGF